MTPSSICAPVRLAFRASFLLASGLLAVQVTVAAPPDITPVPVTISGPLPVPVGPVSLNGTVSVRDVDNAARSPFSVSFCTGGGFGGGTAPSCGGLGISTQVPSNRRMVIEYISGDCSRSGDVQLIQVSVGTTAGGTGALYRVRFGLNALDSRFLEAAQPVRIYGDPGTFVSMGSSFSSGAAAGSVGCTITLSGYTVAI